MKKLTLFISLAACAFVAKADRYRITCCDRSVHDVTLEHTVVSGDVSQLPIPGKDADVEVAIVWAKIHCSNGCYSSIYKLVAEGPTSLTAQSQPSLKTEDLKNLIKSIRNNNKVALCFHAEQQ